MDKVIISCSSKCDYRWFLRYNRLFNERLKLQHTPQKLNTNLFQSYEPYSSLMAICSYDQLHRCCSTPTHLLPSHPARPGPQRHGSALPTYQVPPTPPYPHSLVTIRSLIQSSGSQDREGLSLAPPTWHNQEEEILSLLLLLQSFPLQWV